MKRPHGTLGGVVVQVKGKNITITPALHDQVVSKMSKLDKYLDRLHEIEVELYTEKTRNADHHNHVEATTHVAGRTIRVKADNGDMYAAIDEAVDRLYRQLNRRKERLKSHTGARLSDALAGSDTSGAPSEDLIQRDLQVEKVDLEPQFEDEAIDMMEDEGRSFLVFLNARNEQINVVYRRTDGSYAVIQPRHG